MIFDTSEKLFNIAQNIIPGGVNSPVRACNSVDSTPVYMSKGKGAYLFDEDNNQYIDFCSSWGPLILGHAREEVVEAVRDSALDGLSFGTCAKREIELAEIIINQVKHIEMFRAVNSGTEATMTAIRLARGVTGRDKILKFDGCYHGHADYLLVSAGSGLLTSGTASSAGITKSATDDVLVAPYNDIQAVENIFAKYADEIAAIIVEPVAGNMGLIEPDKAFLQALRDITKKHSSLLIFDEVITGFRLGACAYSDIIEIYPDITCFGKIIGGGLPIGGFGASREIMEHLAPVGDVYQAGTLSGNPVALAAGITSLNLLINENPYDKLAQLAKKVEDSVSDRDDILCHRLGGLFTIFFTHENEIKNLEDVKKCDTNKFAEFFKYMLQNNIYISPSQFELSFVSSAHSAKDIDDYINLLKNFA